jgi:hypothetical protein
MNAAGIQDTHRRTKANMARADRTGLTVRITFTEDTGPNNQVTGAITMPYAANTRFTPLG